MVCLKTRVPVAEYKLTVQGKLDPSGKRIIDGSSEDPGFG
jgi:hypothetical protein